MHLCRLAESQLIFGWVAVSNKLSDRLRGLSGKINDFVIKWPKKELGGIPVMDIMNVRIYPVLFQALLTTLCATTSACPVLDIRFARLPSTASGWLCA
jgi:hypothetical protein